MAWGEIPSPLTSERRSGMDVHPPIDAILSSRGKITLL